MPLKVYKMESLTSKVRNGGAFYGLMHFVYDWNLD